jgi:nucleoid-associated protein YgaU
MPKDAKLGLLVGVGVVITIAVVFFRTDGAPSLPFIPEAAAASVNAPQGGSQPPVQSMNATGPETPSTPEPVKKAEAKPTGRHHVVQAGDTLFTLAEHYYGAKDRFVVIFQANRALLNSPDTLTPGTDLVIPDVSDEQTSSAADRP